MPGKRTPAVPRIPAAQIALCFICDRRIFASPGRGRSSFVDGMGVARPAHDLCLATQAVAR